MSAKELVEKSLNLRLESRFEEALIAARAAIEEEPEEANAWWQVCLCSDALHRDNDALEAAAHTTELAPSFASGWARRGTLETRLNLFDQALNSFRIALEYDQELIEALSGLAGVLYYQKSEDPELKEEEIFVLTHLDETYGLDDSQLNRLGILHYENKHGHNAIKYWLRGVKGDIGRNIAMLFNLGLAYNLHDVSQDLDAIDCWRMCLDIDGSYEPPKNSLERVVPRIEKLAREVRAQGENIILPENQWFDFYLNPFELVNADPNISVEDIDAKQIKKWRQNVLQEIELEDGRVEWLSDLEISKSRAIELMEELNDPGKLEYHLAVFHNKSLMNFLSRGDISHFLLDSSEANRELILLYYTDNAFPEWLGRIFVPIYSKVFTNAMKDKNLLVIECMLDGRRWIPASMSDACFNKAIEFTENIIEPLVNLEKQSEIEKYSAFIIRDLLKKTNIVEIFNLLPQMFRGQQNKAVSLIRSMSINMVNEHGDTDEAIKILEICHDFEFKSIELTQRLKKDFEDVKDIIAQERKYESHLSFGSGNQFKITKDGIYKDDDFCAIEDVETVAWGGRIERDNRHNYLFRICDKEGRKLIATWTTQPSKEQEDLFFGMVNAALYYLIPTLLTKISMKIASGRSVRIGEVTLDRYGATFTKTGFFRNKEVTINWRDMDVEFANGDSVIVDKRSRQKAPSLSNRDIDNAVLLRILPETIQNLIEQ